jgi:hypothetical protein
VELPQRHDDVANWGYRPTWRPRLADCPIDVTEDLGETPLNWLVFEDGLGVGARAADQLTQAGHRVIRVRPGDMYARLSDSEYVVPPEQGRLGYASLLGELEEAGDLPERIAHFWLVTDEETFRPGSSFFDRNLEMGFYGLTALAQELGNVELPGDLHLTVFTTGAVQVREEALRYPEKAMIAGPIGVIPKELPGMTCASVDIELPKRPQGLKAWLGQQAQVDITPRILEELFAEPDNLDAAWRGDKRFELDWRP